MFGQRKVKGIKSKMIK